MANYEKYRSIAGITNNQMIDAIKECYPNYSKIQQSMVNSPEKYGICLTSDAEQLLVYAFGYAPGLNMKSRKKREVKRAKSHHFTVRLDETSYDMVKAKMQQEGFLTAQEFIEEAIKKMI